MKVEGLEADTDNDVMKYFAKYASARDLPKGLAKRSATGLCRYGVTTMTELCSLCEHTPEKLENVRSVGKKCAALILEICAAYKTENIGRKRT